MKSIKILTLLLLIITSFTILVSCRNNDDEYHKIIVTNSLDGKPSLVGNIASNFPLVTDETSINILITNSFATSHKDIYVWKKYQEMTGVKINWTEVDKDNRAAVTNNVLINKQNIDLIMRCKISSNRLIQYGSSGLILDLAKDDLLKKYAPNCWAYLQSHPETLASVLNPDGSIYSLPQVNSNPELRVSRKIFINKNWLDNLDLEIPTTTEEFYQLLKAFKEYDANGNGDLNDEIPLCSPDWMSIQEAFFGAFGLGNRGLHNQIVDYDNNTNKARLIAYSNAYQDYLKYFNKLYTEGLLDQYTFSMTSSQWYNNALNDRIGVFASTNLATLPANKIDNWVAVEEALEGPNGDKLWTAIRTNFHSTGAAVIPSTCKNPQLVLQWLDYFWTDEGTLFYHMGIENETFIVNSDGTYDYMPYIYQEMISNGASFDQIVSKYSPYPGGSNPTVEIPPYFVGGEMATVPANAARSLFEYGPTEYWPSFTFLTSENDELNGLRKDIEKYISNMCIEFITGVSSFDDWDSYLSQLDSLNASKFLEIYQAAIDRYEANKQ